MHSVSSKQVLRRGGERERECERDGSVLLCLLESPPSCSSQAGIAFSVMSALCACMRVCMCVFAPDVMGGMCLMSNRRPSGAVLGQRIPGPEGVAVRLLPLY